MTETDQRAAIVREALSWLGTPYHHHGRIKGVGVDCLMLIAEVFEKAGVVQHVDPGFYAVDWHLHRSEEMYAEGLGRYAHRLPDDALPQLGDIALFRFGRTFSHGAIVVDIDGPQFVHSYIRRGVILTRLTEEPLDGRPVQWWSAFA